jgi:hypothetical protein
MSNKKELYINFFNWSEVLHNASLMAITLDRNGVILMLETLKAHCSEHSATYSLNTEEQNHLTALIIQAENIACWRLRFVTRQLAHWMNQYQFSVTADIHRKIDLRNPLTRGLRAEERAKLAAYGSDAERFRIVSSAW